MLNPWKVVAAMAGGAVEPMLLAQIEYLMEEVRVLRAQIPGKIKFTDAEICKYLQILGWRGVGKGQVSDP